MFYIYSGRFVNLSACFIFTAVDLSTSTPVMKCQMCGNDMLLKTKKDGKGLVFIMPLE